LAAACGAVFGVCGVDAGGAVGAWVSLGVVAAAAGVSVAGAVTSGVAGAGLGVVRSWVRANGAAHNIISRTIEA
jgi:hypothetical protein